MTDQSRDHNLSSGSGTNSKPSWAPSLVWGTDLANSSLFKHSIHNCVVCDVAPRFMFQPSILSFKLVTKMHHRMVKNAGDFGSRSAGACASEGSGYINLPYRRLHTDWACFLPLPVDPSNVNGKWRFAEFLTIVQNLLHGRKGKIARFLPQKFA